jgi:hypothetical protein
VFAGHLLLRSIKGVHFSLKGPAPEGITLREQHYTSIKNWIIKETG